MFVAENKSEIVGFIQGVVVDHKGDNFHKLTKVEGLEGWIGQMMPTAVRKLVKFY